MEELLHLEGNSLTIKGATKVLASTQTQAVVEAGEKCFVINGSEIEVKMLNLEDGEVEFYGKISMIKIGQPQQKKGSLFKRIFK